MPSVSETTINVELANLLRSKHPRWLKAVHVEETDVFEQRRLKPDIVVDSGIPVVIESEFQPATTVEEDAMRRLGGVTTISGRQVETVVAVRFPATLREPSPDLAKILALVRFEYCVISGIESPFNRSPKRGWFSGDIDNLVRCIELVALSERFVEDGLNVLEVIITRCGRLMRSIGGEVMHKRLGQVLSQQPGEQTNRMALAILSNAFTFYSSIQKKHALPTLDELRSETGALLTSNLLRCWRYVLNEINYWPIFKVASEIVNCLDYDLAPTVFENMYDATQELNRVGTATIHDLSARLFQRMIVDRKFLATFYTLPSSAALLAELAVDRLPHDWSSPFLPMHLHIADLACGTGTLLTAAYQSIASRVRRQGQDDAQLHKSLIAQSLIGADIMPAASHLTASQLSGVHPSETFDRTMVYTMPYGKQSDESAFPLAIGSLELIAEDGFTTLFGTGRIQVRGDQIEQVKELRLPKESLDLVIMNPPFTRPTNHALTDVPVPSFAGFDTSKEEQKAMSDRLKIIRRSLTSPIGNGYAGLASNFLDLAHVKIRPGGVLAFVLPRTFLRGVAWQAARDVITRQYRDICVVSIVETKSTRSAFSADTAMAEILLIATRLLPGEKPVKDDILFINLASRPSTLHEAIEVASRIRSLDEMNSGEVVIGGHRAFSFLRTPIGNAGVAGVSSIDLCKFMLSLSKGEFLSVRDNLSISMPITRLQTLGECGPVHRLIGSPVDSRPRGPFAFYESQHAATYPALWSHDALRERQMEVLPDTRGVIREGEDDRARHIWQTATRLHFSLDFRTTSQSLSACLTPESTLGGRAWPSYKLRETQWESGVTLWANSTLGLLSHWWGASRQQSGRSMLTVSTLPDLLVLDVRALSASQRARCEAIYGEMKNARLLSAKDAVDDPTRASLDQMLLVDTLGMSPKVLPALELLRSQWCVEPSVSGVDIVELSRSA